MDEAHRRKAAPRTLKAALGVLTVLCGMAYGCAGFSTLLSMLFVWLLEPGSGFAVLLLFLQTAFGLLLIACGYILVVQRRTRDLLRFTLYPVGGLIALFAVLWALQDVIDVIEEIYY